MNLDFSMGLKKRIVGGYVSIFNVKKCIGYEHIEKNADFILSLIGLLFSSFFKSKNKTGHSKRITYKNFAAMARHTGLTEEVRLERIRAGYRSISMYIVLFILVCCYQLYLVCIAHLYSTFASSLILNALIAVFMFREMVACYQLEVKKMRFAWKDFRSFWFSRR